MSSKPKRSSGPTPSTASSPSIPFPPAHCYCSDPTPLQSDLICSYNTPQCYATHISCLKDNAGVPFTSFVVGRSCFLCAHCVRRRGFKHPAFMECTLDSQYGCFYEAKADAQRARDAKDRSDAEVAAQSSAAAAEEKDEDDAASARGENGHLNAPSPIPPSSPTAPSTAASAVLPSSGAEAAASSAVDDDSAEPKAKSKRRGIRDADRKGKGKLVPRCTSPSHFLVEDPSSAPSSAPPSMASAVNPRLVDKLRTDALLSSVSALYYRPRLPHLNNLDVWVSAEYDRLEYSTVDSLLSPLRRPSPLDEWSPYELALFESGICCYGKDFHAISRLLSGSKSCGQCVDLYYVWKKSGHYALWKEFGKPVRRRGDGKGEQLRAVREKMSGWKGAGGGHQDGLRGGVEEKALGVEEAAATVNGASGALKRKRGDDDDANGDVEEKRAKAEDAQDPADDAMHEAGQAMAVA